MPPHWSRDDKRTGAASLILLGIIALGVAYENYSANFSLGNSGLTDVSLGLLGFIGIAVGAFLLLIM